MLIKTDILIEKAAIQAFNINKYMYIMDNMLSMNISENEEFMTCYDNFYRIRRNSEWREIYFKYFEEQKYNKEICFSDIIIYLFEKTGNIEPSFSSKMLATINDNMPIWDQYVLKNLGFVLKGKNSRERLNNTIVLYDEIVKWYQNYLHTENCKECIEIFDKLLPSYTKITDTKKIDFLLWVNR